MKNLYLLFLIHLFFGCAKEKEAIQGNLQDFISGEMSFERDAETGFMGFRGTVDYQLKVVAIQNGIFKYYDPLTGRKLGSFEIPSEGPISLKGGAHIAKSFGESTTVATNSRENTNVYKSDTLFSSFQLVMNDLEPANLFHFL